MSGSKKLNVLDLDFKKTLPYFIDQVGCGKTLARKITEDVDFHQGKFFTTLPLSADLNQVYEFSYGGIIPPAFCSDNSNNHDLLFKEDISPYTSFLEMIEKEMCLFIDRFLNKNEERHAIIEDYMLDPENDPPNLVKLKPTTYKGKEAYYFLNKKNSLDDIYSAIRSCTEVWHFLCVLTKIENKYFEELKEEKINLIIKNLDYIITNAYDGEGYIFWERQR